MPVCVCVCVLALRWYWPPGYPHELCVCVCVCVCLYFSLCVRACFSLSLSVYACVRACVRARSRVSLSLSLCVCVCVCVCVSLCACVCACVRACVRVSLSVFLSVCACVRGASVLQWVFFFLALLFGRDEVRTCVRAHRVSLHRCIMGWGPSAMTWGLWASPPPSGPGDGGIHGGQRRGRGKVQNLPLRWSLRRGAGTYPSFGSLGPQSPRRMNLGGDPAQPRRLGHGIARLTPRRPPWGATMAQGGLHRGVAVCKGAPGLLVTQPAPGLASVFSAPHPIAC